MYRQRTHLISRLLALRMTLCRTIVLGFKGMDWPSEGPGAQASLERCCFSHRHCTEDPWDTKKTRDTQDILSDCWQVRPEISSYRARSFPSFSAFWVTGERWVATQKKLLPAWDDVSWQFHWETLKQERLGFGRLSLCESPGPRSPRCPSFQFWPCCTLPGSSVWPRPPWDWLRQSFSYPGHTERHPAGHPCCCWGQSQPVQCSTPPLHSPETTSSPLRPRSLWWWHSACPTHWTHRIWLLMDIVERLSALLGFQVEFVPVSQEVW